MLGMSGLGAKIGQDSTLCFKGYKAIVLVILSLNHDSCPRCPYLPVLVCCACLCSASNLCFDFE